MTQTLSTNRLIFYPMRRQLRPATIPNSGSVIESTEAVKDAKASVKVVLIDPKSVIT